MRAMDTRAFFDIMGAAPAAVTVVTTVDRLGRAHGLTAAAVCSVSAEPPLLLVCIDRRSRTLPALRESRAFAVNFLRGDRADVAARFAARVVDRFDGIDWRPGESGVPILHRDSLAYAECRTTEEIDAGDHVVLIARVVAGAPPPAQSRPLMYFRHRYGPWPGEVDDARAEPSDGPVERPRGPVARPWSELEVASSISPPVSLRRR
jgi:flavin reductase (DIM6/NTAB) family NADH-FMN oxidoreductase RutF